MGTWNNLQKGFTVNERLPDAIVDISSFDVFSNVTRLYRQTLKKPPCYNFGQLQGSLILSY